MFTADTTQQSEKSLHCILQQNVFPIRITQFNYILLLHSNFCTLEVFEKDCQV